MPSAAPQALVLVTGASGHIGREVCRHLRSAGSNVVGVDVSPGDSADCTVCDLTQTDSLRRLFESQQIKGVIHLAAILPSAFGADPLRAVELNLGASFALMREAARAGAERFIFASSMSVYGSSNTSLPLTEEAPATPDEPYGGAKRTVELVGECLRKEGIIEFAALRIARVVGPKIGKTSSPWRAQIFEQTRASKAIRIPFSPDASLLLVHVQEVARMLVTLSNTPTVCSSVYNSPVEIWTAQKLREEVERTRNILVELDPNGIGGGPVCDGSKFVREFGFQLRSLREHLRNADKDLADTNA